jgi:hypothetical protein
MDVEEIGCEVGASSSEWRPVVDFSLIGFFSSGSTTTVLVM